MIGEFHPDRPSLADTFTVFGGQSEQVDGKLGPQNLSFLLLSRRNYRNAAMAIEPVQGQSNKYRRVGLVTDVQHFSETLGLWFVGSKSMTIKII
jgi:hypothetical protein